MKTYKQLTEEINKELIALYRNGVDHHHGKERFHHGRSEIAKGETKGRHKQAADLHKNARLMYQQALLHHSTGADSTKLAISAAELARKAKKFKVIVESKELQKAADNYHKQIVGQKKNHDDWILLHDHFSDKKTDIGRGHIEAANLHRKAANAYASAIELHHSDKADESIVKAKEAWNHGQKAKAYSTTHHKKHFPDSEE